MGCLSDREKGPKEESQKWDFITLSDFRCTSAWTVVAYIWLWVLALVGIAVYVVDTFTAVNLLAFDQWSSSVKPALDFKYSKWIFSVCILLSWALCIYEWIRAIRVIRRGGVAQSFLDPLAVDIQSMRPRGFKRFLVFTALTKSRKGADYVALFVYFSFKTALRVIICEGPRQGVNAMTLFAVLQADLIPGKEQTDHNNFDQFWINIGALANQNTQQAVIYFSMLFTLVIWVFSALSLIISCVLYLCFLWHYIPQQDGSLSTYCRRKVDKRLARVVAHKVQAAIEEEERRRRKAEEKAERKAAKTGELPPPAQVQIGIKKQPTLPNLGSPETGKDDKLPEFTLRRQETDMSVSTLPPYESRPPTRGQADRLTRQPTLPDLSLDSRPGMARTNTGNSTWSNAPSYHTNAPLLEHAGLPGQSEPLPTIPGSAHSSFQQPWHERSASQSTQGSMRDGSVRSQFAPGPRMQTPMSARPYTPSGMGPGPGYGRPPPVARGPTSMRSNAPLSYDQERQSAVSAPPTDGYGRSFTAPVRANTADGFRPGPGPERTYGSLHSQQSFSRPMPRPQGPHGSSSSLPRAYTPSSSGELPPQLSHQNSYEMTPQPNHSIPPAQPFAPSRTPGPSQTPAPPSAGGYLPFNPSVLTPVAAPETPRLQEGPRRNITLAAGPPGTEGSYFGDVRQVPQRSATAPLEPQRVESARISVNDVLDDYGSSTPDEGIHRPHPAPNPVQQRSATAGPTPGGPHDWRQFS
ncbi:putative vacuolar membrane protein [Pseudocercospora fuligena]|uniref:Putative vacuolar membrane protein n=1 Tax=Pseudocercospora fuligena TaxID=685502 RepID=A0A8H6RT64_9PEZI|nr:putative vacuolar membrane protein [Pseudocercospora fuligena]